MTNAGLKQAQSFSHILSHYDKPVSDSVIAVIWEGSRLLLAEVQAIGVDEKPFS